MADALTAVQALDAADDPERLHLVLRALGLAGQEPRPAAEPTPDPLPRPRPDAVAPPQPRPEPTTRPDRRSPDRTGTARLDVLGSERPPAVRLTESPGPSWAFTAQRPVLYRPPVPDRLVRAAIGALAGRRRSTLRPDLPALVGIAARGRPVTAVPTTAEASLSAGVLVFADLGQEMEPYLRDVHYFVSRIRGVAGAAATRVVWLGDLDDAGPDRADPLQEPLDRPALVVSALGRPRTPAADPRSRQRWARLLDRLDGSPHGYAVLTPRRSTARDLLAAGRRAVAWDDLSTAGRGHG
jgi:hypothetical protein